MSSLMNAYAEIAATYGKVNPKDPQAVQRFFEITLPKYSPKKQQQVVDDLFTKTTGIDGSLSATTSGPMPGAASSNTLQKQRDKMSQMLRQIKREPARAR
ncbi:MAG: hypothetical protein HOP32_08945 [Nitrospira sp.]|nr:hypothetical protein [Nitrospira sp.]